MSDPTNPPPGGGPATPPTAPANAARSLPVTTPTGVHAMRRGGARREVTERVTLNTEDGRKLDGWALNVSRGGLRAILEDKVILGQRFDVDVGADDDLIRRQGRVVWVQEEPDGVIVGIEFTGAAANAASVPPAPPGSQRIPSFPAPAPEEEK